MDLRERIWDSAKAFHKGLLAQLAATLSYVYIHIHTYNIHIRVFSFL